MDYGLQFLLALWYKAAIYGTSTLITTLLRAMKVVQAIFMSELAYLAVDYLDLDYRLFTEDLLAYQ